MFAQGILEINPQNQASVFTCRENETYCILNIDTESYFFIFRSVMVHSILLLFGKIYCFIFCIGVYVSMYAWYNKERVRQRIF